LIITIQENNLVLMSGILVAAIAAGTAVMFFQSRFATQAASGIQHTFREWFRINWFGLGAGIAAAWAIWNSQYLRVESFGAAGVDYIALLAACAVAFTGAGVTGSLGQQGVMSGQGRRSTQTDTGKGSDSGGE
jgi:predicted membrane-bound mannosyltransferase